LKNLSSVMKFLVFLLLSIVSQICMAQDLVVVTDPLHTGHVDGNVRLKCDYEPPQDYPNSYLIKWNFLSITSEEGAEMETVFVQDSDQGGVAYGDFVGRAAVIGDRGDLEINSLRLSDTGTYECMVQFHIAQVSGDVTTELDVYQTVLEVDIVGYEEAAYIPAPAGKETKLTCVARQGRPAASLVWYKDHTQMNPSQNNSVIDNLDGTYDTTSSITIVTDAMDYGATVKCESNQEPEIPYKNEQATAVLNTANFGNKIAVSSILLFFCAIISLL